MASPGGFSTVRGKILLYATLNIIFVLGKTAVIGGGHSKNYLVYDADSNEWLPGVKVAHHRAFAGYSVHRYISFFNL